MSSLKSQILDEIKAILKEGLFSRESDTGDWRDTVNKVIRAPKKELTMGGLGASEMFYYLDLDDVDLKYDELRRLFANNNTWTGGAPEEAKAAYRKICAGEVVYTEDGNFYYVHCKNNIPCMEFKLGRKNTPVPQLLGALRGNKARTDIRCSYSVPDSPQPKPPVPPPPVPPPESPKPPKPEFKHPGCPPNSQFVGKNGIIKGSQVESVQIALSLFELRPMTDKFEYANMSDLKGTFGPATEQAVYDFQKSRGGRYASRIKTELGSSLGNPDACVGPKTACALVLAVGQKDAKFKVAGYDLNRCKNKFGKKKIEKGVLAKTEVPEQPEAVAESKNWLDRTREETASNLFERLVKDSANKKII